MNTIYLQTECHQTPHHIRQRPSAPKYMKRGRGFPSLSGHDKDHRKQTLISRLPCHTALYSYLDPTAPILIFKTPIPIILTSRYGSLFQVAPRLPYRTYPRGRRPPSSRWHPSPKAHTPDPERYIISRVAIQEYHAHKLRPSCDPNLSRATQCNIHPPSLHPV